MPIYEYQCPHCGKVFEEWVKLSDAHEEMLCPDCKVNAPRLISHTSFVLKGGGWYVTDYGYRKGIKEDVPAEKSSSSGKEEGSKTAKSADKAETPYVSDNVKTYTKPVTTQKAKTGSAA